MSALTSTWRTRLAGVLAWAIALVLFICAIVNLFTKEMATIAGVAFTGAFFAMFVVLLTGACRRSTRPARTTTSSRNISSVTSRYETPALPRFESALDHS